jgi:hypothetical protein
VHWTSAPPSAKDSRWPTAGGLKRRRCHSQSPSHPRSNPWAYSATTGRVLAQQIFARGEEIAGGEPAQLARECRTPQAGQDAATRALPALFITPAVVDPRRPQLSRPSPKVSLCPWDLIGPLCTTGARQASSHT